MQTLLGRVHQIARHAEDLDRAVDFYRDTLGSCFIARFDPSGLAFFDLGNMRLLLNRGAPAALLYLDVDDIEASFSSLAGRGVEFTDEPHRIHRDEDGLFGPAGAEEWMAFFRDSEQNLLALVERRLGATAPEDHNGAPPRNRAPRGERQDNHGGPESILELAQRQWKVLDALSAPP